MKLLIFTIIVNFIISFTCFGGGELKKVSAIEIHGLTKTKKYVLLRELEYQPTDVVSEKLIRQSIQNLKNTRLFSKVEHEFKLIINTNIYRSIYTVVERWTTIPIMKFQDSGGIKNINLGFYDINFLGRNIELGLQLGKMGTQYSAVLWYRNPRLTSNLYLQIDLWLNSLVLKDFKDYGRLNEVENEYILRRKKTSILIGKEWNNFFKSNISLVALEDSFKSLCELCEGTPQLSSNLKIGLGIELGLINIDSFLREGVLFSNKYFINLGLNQKSTANHGNFNSRLIYFKILPYYLNLALRLELGTTNAKSRYQKFRIGGFDKIRGFTNNRFSASRYWLNNLELRYPVFMNNYLVAQSVVFLDSYGGDVQATTELPKVSAASSGIGIRMIFPQVYRLVLRFDYAKALKSDVSFPLSVAVQQFF